MSNRLNCDEILARKWLESQGHCVRRPCQDPPDFVADGTLGVEVRRLNCQVKGQGEEEFEQPLGRLIKATIKGMTPKRGTWIVYGEFPYAEGLPDAKEAKKGIQQAVLPLTERVDGEVLDELRSRYLNRCEHSHELDLLEELHLCLPCGIHLDLVEVESSSPGFKLGNISQGKGILLEAGLKKSMEFAIEVKTTKIKDREQDYEWWLVLVDHIGVVPGSGLSGTELADLCRGVRVTAPWSRVVIVSRRTPEWWYELCPDDEVPRKV